MKMLVPEYILGHRKLHYTVFIKSLRAQTLERDQLLLKPSSEQGGQAKHWQSGWIVKSSVAPQPHTVFGLLSGLPWKKIFKLEGTLTTTPHLGYED